MKPGFRWLLGIAVATMVTGRAATSLDHAREARAMLAPGTWVRILRIENTAAHSDYPRTLAALVFEFDGILWFYTDTDGTQSLSLHRGCLAEEEADLAPLLAAIDPGFAHFEIFAAEDAPAPPPAGAPPNACFIESIAALRDRLARGDLLVEARLLAFYARVDGRIRGHTVLAYQTPGGAFVVDGTAGAPPRRLDRELPGAAIMAARRWRPDLDVERACWVPAPLPDHRAMAVAEAPRRRTKDAVLR